MKVVAILQARCSSTRLPNKVLKEIQGKAMLHQQIDRLNRSKCINELIVATSVDASDNKLVELCKKININVYRGSLNNVLERFYIAAKINSADIVVRLTGDCPLASPEIIDAVIRQHILDKNDYTSNIEPETFPDGLDVEVFNFPVLKKAWQNATTKSDLEHVTPYIRNNLGVVKGNYISDLDYSHFRWTVDEPEDFNFVREVYSLLGSKGNYFDYNEIFKLLDERPELLNINSNIIRNEGYINSLHKDKLQDKS